jgi:hypothetical protein
MIVAQRSMLCIVLCVLAKLFGSASENSNAVGHCATAKNAFNLFLVQFAKH